MDFTKGKRRQYERIMKEKPGFAHSQSSEEEERELRRQAQEAEQEHRNTGSEAAKRTGRADDGAGKTDGW
ncbi:hypothetical protein [Cohnella silvisoli]|uniref:YfhD family protein n=1 Tax=Cohnella silvisoli TaxID=2873699 RepID=A0ABV1KVD6_9BACL|nr:hypothetical protein [Cohnella silvisoli]MCD9023468.1 hypothetical protein [Cohnella silvisoli]